jgi:hypothetical protein
LLIKPSFLLSVSNAVGASEKDASFINGGPLNLGGNAHDEALAAPLPKW